jgi:hypothetical protein
MDTDKEQCQELVYLTQVALDLLDALLPTAGLQSVALLSLLHLGEHLL